MTDDMAEQEREVIINDLVELCCDPINGDIARARLERDIAFLESRPELTGTYTKVLASLRAARERIKEVPA